MHELSVAQSLVELIDAQLMAAGLEAARVTRVRVAVGAMSAVVPAALASAFGPASAGSAADGAELVIEPVPVVVWCDACGAEASPVQGRLVCPTCGGRTPTIVRGKELELVSLEFSDDDDANDDRGRRNARADARGDASGSTRGDAADFAGAADDPEEQ